MRAAVIIVTTIVILGGLAYFLQKSGLVMRATPRLATSTYVWNVNSAGEDSQGTPHSQIELIVPGNQYNTGTYAGICQIIDGVAWKFIRNEVSGVLCWWAGGGDEIGVFEEGNRTVIRHGLLDEGDAENPGTRGNFVELFTL